MLWEKCFSTVSTLADLEKAGWCFLLCLDCGVEGDLFHAVDLISTASESHLLSPPYPEFCPSVLPSPCTPDSPLCMEADWRHSTELGWEAQGSYLSPFPSPVVSQLMAWSWCSFLRRWCRILEGAYYCCTGQELSMTKWSGLGCSDCWEQDPFLGDTWAGHSLWMLDVSLLVWAEPVPIYLGFFAVTVLPALENSMTLSYVQGSQSLSMNLSNYKCKSPGRSN